MNALKIGWASRDVTTDQPVSIPGQFHIRISKGIHDPILVTALVVDDGQDMAIFVSADIVVIRNHLVDEIRERVAARNPAIPVDKIIMNATHTHTGPSVYGIPAANRESGSVTAGVDDIPFDEGAAPPDDVYREFFCDNVVAAIDEAFTRRAPGGIAYGYGYAVVAHSRRAVYFDDVSKRPGAVINSTHGVNGHAQMYGNTADENFSHYEAGADHFMNLLFTFTPAGALSGAIVNIPCPSQNSEGDSVLSASFWNEVREAIRARYGDVHILAQGAAGGDLSPRILHYRQAQQRRFKLKYGDAPEAMTELNARRDIGERVADAFHEVLEWAKNDIQYAMPVSHAVETVMLDKRRITPEEAAYEREQLDALMAREFKTDGTSAERLVHDSQLVSSRKRCRRVLQRFETQDREPEHAMELHVVRLGDVAFATNQFELYMDFMHRIQARSPFIQTFVVQLTGIPGADGGTYLATERGAWGKGYSASRYCNTVSPQGGQTLVEETLRLLNTVAGDTPPD